MLDRKTRARILLTVLVYGAVGVLTWVSRNYPADWHFPQLLAFFVMAWLAESDTVPIPQLNAYLSVSFAVFLVAIMMLGPLPAAVVAASAVLADGTRRRSRPLNLVYNVGQVYLSVLVTGTVLVLIGQIPPDPSSLSSIVTVLGVSVALAFSLNTVLVDAFLATRSPSFWGGFWSTAVIDLRSSPLSYLVTGMLGILMYYIYLTPLGLLGTGFLLLALIAVRFSARHTAELREAHFETMRILSEVLDARDPYTHGHSARVAELAREIASAMGLPDPEQQVIESAALLHDIGKVAIQDDILFKTGALTDAEFARMREHPERGAQMIRPIGFLKSVQEIVRYHHERYDGKGYPYGIKGTAIPLGARIVAVADAWDAMTSHRAYRAALDPKVGVEQLLSGRGTQFDPQVVDVFVNKVLPARGVRIFEEKSVQRGEPALEHNN